MSKMCSAMLDDDDEDDDDDDGDVGVATVRGRLLGLSQN